MPYKLFPVRNEDGKLLGYKVGKKDGSKMSNGRRFASNKPLSKKRATAQMQAIIINEKG
jgi:hypothetical protein